MEQEALQLADCTTIVSTNWASDLHQLGGHNIHTITNGFDPEDYLDLSPISNGYFSFTHLGLLGNDRIPEGLLQVIGELNTENPLFAQQFRLQLVGQASPKLLTTAKQYGVNEEQLQFLGSVSHQKALALAAGSVVNLLLLNQQPNAAGRIPFKLFEYLAVGRPILAFGVKGSDVEQILEKTGRGNYLDYLDLPAIKHWLKEQFADFQNERTTPLAPFEDERLRPYSVRQLTAQLAALLDTLAK